MKKITILYALLCSFNLFSQNIVIENQVFFYKPQQRLDNTGRIFLDGLIKKSIINIDTCIVQYSSHRLNKIKRILVVEDKKIIEKIDSIDSDIVSDCNNIRYKRIEISGKLIYLSKTKVAIMNSKNKIF